MPVAMLRAGRIAVSLVAGSFLASGFAIAPAFASSARPMGSPCGHSSVAAVSARELAMPAASASTSPTGSSSPSASRSPSGSSSPSQTKSPTPSASNSPSPSKSRSPSPSPSRSHTKSASPSPSPSRSHKAGAICVTSHLVTHSSNTRPGGTVTYSIWIWSTVPATRVAVRASSSARTMKFPRFTLCPSAHGTSCTIARLPANQAFELMVTDRVRAAATVGAAITLTVSVQAAPLSPAEAAVATVVSQRSQPPVGGSVPPVPPLPPTTLQPIPNATIIPPSLGGLFPTVTPTSSPAARQNQGRRAGRAATRITQTSSALPFDPRLIGGQLAGLAVLAAAITMVMARLSLRTPQPASPGQAGPATADSAAEAKDDQPAADSR